MTAHMLPTIDPATAAGPAVMRRGACPSLSAPMLTGDGLLVRLRPAEPGLLLGDLSRIAEMAQRHGNGILEVTARGNLQVRGLSAETAPAFAAEIEGSGIGLAEGLAIETPALSGLDPSEFANPLPLAQALRDTLARQHPPLKLAPKLAVIIDGGGAMHLGEVTADVRARAFPDRGQILWLISVGGTDRTARPVAVVAEGDVAAVLLAILERLSAQGHAARGRDLDVAAARTLLRLSRQLEPVPLRPVAPMPAGRHALDPSTVVLGLGLAFGQMESAALTRLLSALRLLGANEVRLVAGHGLLVRGIALATIAAAQAVAQGEGFRIHGDDPGNAIAACSGKGACRSALLDTKAMARSMIATAPAVLDGSMAVHVSGCAKGCARPAASMLTFVGTPNGTGLVVNGAASAAPAVYIDEKTITSSLVRLQALVSDEKHAGESARSCLTRLGTDRIATAVQQG